MPLPLTIHGVSHVGLVHEVNEDSWSELHTDEGAVVLMVCDGMGGMGHGDEASALAVSVLSDELRAGSGYPTERLRRALRRADVVVRERLCAQGRGLPGSTAVVVYVLDGLAHVAWVGDSRAYLVRGDAVIERTTDHKLLDELLAAGRITAQEARASTLAHVVTRALGGRPPSDRAVAPDTLDHPWRLARGDLVVLCSDGVSDLVDDHELARLLHGRDPEAGAAAVLQTALDRGGHDNITCVVARWDGPDYVEDDMATPLMPGPRDLAPDIRDLREPPPPPKRAPAASDDAPPPSQPSSSGDARPKSWVPVAVSALLVLAFLTALLLAG